jgi:2-isopropylmalate synthase
LKKMDTRAVLIYDTTLRDGTQGEQVNFTAEEKLRVARRLDEFGVAYIEGGWPGSNPKDMRFFELARAVKFRNARLAAFGSTRRAHTPPGECPNVQALLEAQTPTVTIFGKSWDLHVKEILKISMKENLAMIGETVAYLKSKKKEVVYDAEHFFDGYRSNPRYALQTIETAFQNGADMIVLCDTNGGTLPSELGRAIDEVAALIPRERLGIHAHNDGGVAVANSIAAVEKGVRMVQGTINGYGERCGNADLIPIMANLELKLKKTCLPEGALKELTRLSLFVSEVANITPLNSRPFIGRSAFAHKGGIHVHAVLKNPVAYEHIAPEIVGNKRRVLVSDLSGRSNIEYKAAEMGLTLGDDDSRSRRIVEEIKHLENEGYTFEAADGSLALIIRKATGEFEEPFYLECFRVINEKQGSEPSRAQALIKVIVGNDTEITAAEGNGPINALDNALRKALVTFYPELAKMHLTDFKVSILEGSEGTAAKVRVFIESRDEKDIWSTIGVSESVIEASWHALVDSVQYKLSKDRLNRNGREERKAVA